MLSELYRSLCSSANPSEELIQQTKQKMRSRLKRDLRPVRPAPYAFVISFSLIAVFIAAVAQFAGRTDGKTNLTAPANGGGHSVVNVSSGAVSQKQASAVQAPSARGRKFHPTVQLANGILVFRELRSEPVSGGIALNCKDEVPWAPAKVIAYLGKDVRPSSLPDGLKPQFDYGSYRQSVFIRKDGSVYYDNITYRYLKDPHDLSSDQMKITVSKGKLPAVNLVYLGGKNSEDLSKSVSKIGHTNVSVQYFGKEYFAEFMSQNVGYYVFSKGISQEDFIKVIQSMVR